MTPIRTQVFLCTTTKEYKRCRRFCKLHGQDHYLAYPTVYAVRDGRIIGVLGTTLDGGMVCMGPLAVHRDVRMKGVVALRLVQVQEALYKDAGLDSYYVFISHDNPGWKRSAEKMLLRPVYETDTHTWYIREGL